VFALHHVQLAMPPGAERDAGHRRFYVDDCFGNRLEFMQPVG
jgi:hypothetical protein